MHQGIRIPHIHKKSTPCHVCRKSFGFERLQREQQAVDARQGRRRGGGGGGGSSKVLQRFVRPPACSRHPRHFSCSCRDSLSFCVICFQVLFPCPVEVTPECMSRGSLPYRSSTAPTDVAIREGAHLRMAYVPCLCH